jgi:hypothetical protein
MEKRTDALSLLLRERPESAPSVSPNLVERIFQLEERVQFDGERGDTPKRIRDAVQAEVDKETLEETGNADAVE